MRIAVIGAGISGIAAARMLMKNGHDVVVFERSAAIGGVWAAAYPQVRLQNVADHYRLTDFPWPFTPDLHPTGEQILRYLTAAVKHFAIDIRLEHEVVALREQSQRWRVDYRSPRGDASELFDYAVIAVGQFTQDKPELDVPGRERFAGTVLTEREVRDLDTLAGKDIVVVGFGKSAVDMATFAAERGSRVFHVFREPRWLVPTYILGIHFRHVLFARMSTAMIPSWVQPTAIERLLHERMKPVVSGFWQMVSLLVRAQLGLHGIGRDPEARRRLETLLPRQPFVYQMRSATAVAPDAYVPMVVKGRILPHRGELAGFTEDGVTLADGTSIRCDTVVVSIGSVSPRFPFLPEEHRRLLEGQPDGVPLYRHILHPRIPRLAFAGFNHGFLHIPAVEISMLWLCAHLRGELLLPTVEEMERCMEHIRDWKREHVLFEPTRAHAVSTRFHQYVDVMLTELGLSPYRKSNPLSELVMAYEVADYRGLVEEYERVRAGRGTPRQVLPLPT